MMIKSEKGNWHRDELMNKPVTQGGGDVEWEDTDRWKMERQILVIRFGK